jgi:hypothetical protein
MDRSGRIGEERREDKPKPAPPPSDGQGPNPPTAETLRPSGNVNPSEHHEPEDPVGTSAA